MSLANWPQLHGDFFAGTKVLITGGGGFIGSHLCEAMVALGAHVKVLDDFTGGDKVNLDWAAATPRGQLDVIDGSILDEHLLGECVAGCQFIFHQAAQPSVSRSVELPRLYHQVNVTGTLNVLEAARSAHVKRVMFAASSSAYGDSETLPKIETMPPLPKSPYAANKLAGEHMMRAYAGSYDVDAVALRYFNIFGPRQNANSAYAGVIAAFAKAMITADKPIIYGDGCQSRDFTFVANAVHANLLAAASNSRLDGEVINVGCGVQITVNDLASKMAQVLNLGQIQPEYREMRAGDVMHSLADLGRAQRLLGYHPIVSFEEGLGAAVQWYRSARPWEK